MSAPVSMPSWLADPPRQPTPWPSPRCVLWSLVAALAIGSFALASAAAKPAMAKRGVPSRATAGCQPGKAGPATGTRANRKAVSRIRRSIARLRRVIARHRRALRDRPRHHTARHRAAIRRSRSTLRRAQRALACKKRPRAVRRAGTPPAPAGPTPVPSAAPTPGSAPGLRPAAPSAPPPVPLVEPPSLQDPTTIKAAPCAPVGPSGAVPADELSRNDLAGGDHIVEIPQRLSCSLWIRGGRNVVVMGGEIDVDGPSTDCRPPAFSPCDPMAHAGVHLAGQTGTVHLEGLWIHGSDLGAGIVLNEYRATSQVNLANIRLEELHTYDTAALWDDRGTPAGLHPDCVASFAGPDRLRIDGLTCGTSYFGLQLSPAGGIPGGVELRRMNLHDNCWSPSGASDRCGHARYMFWFRTQAGTAPWTTRASDVWAEAGPTAGGRGPFTWGVCDVDGDQNCARVTSPITFGRRPSDFVPAGSVGVGYQRPR